MGSTQRCQDVEEKAICRRVNLLPKPYKQASRTLSLTLSLSLHPDLDLDPDPTVKDCVLRGSTLLF